MKLDIQNYFDQVEQYLDIIQSDADFKATYDFIHKITKKGKEPENLDADEGIREMFDLFVENLNKRMAGKAKGRSSGKSATPDTKPPKTDAAKQKPASKPRPQATVSKTATRKEKTDRETEQEAEKVEHIPSDIALVKKYISLHDKQKTYDQVLSVWRAFNKAIVERKVTKDSPFKSEIATMNKSLSVALEEARNVGSLHLIIPNARLNTYTKIATSVEKSASVPILLEYINISGKDGMQERAHKLIKRIERTTNSGKLKGDRYAKDMKTVQEDLEAYINRETDVVMLTDYTLNGISEIAIFGCPCQNGVAGFTPSQNAVIYKLIQEKVKNLQEPELERAFSDTIAPNLCKTIAQKLIDKRQLSMSLIRNPAKVVGRAALGSVSGVKGFDLETEIIDMRLRNAGAKQPAPKAGNKGLSGFEVVSQTVPEQPVKIISAIDMMSLKFRTIGLKGKYRQLIGDPEPGFSAMISGKPKGGKSTLAIDLAKELTPYGRALYCVYEEGHGMLLQDKIIRNKANVPGLDFANKLPSPAEMSLYKFVFIDSVSDARITEETFGNMIKTFKPKGTSIVGIFHATKDGKFRGGQTYAHDVDILIEVADGKAYAKGRYAPPSEMSIAALMANSFKRAA